MYSQGAVVSRTPEGLSVLAERVTGVTTTFVRSGSKVRAVLMAPHDGFGTAQWWEPKDREVMSWWDNSGVSAVPDPAMCVHPDGSVTRVMVSACPAGLRKIREAATHIAADLHRVSYVPAAAEHPDAFPASPVGTLLVAAGRADFEHRGELVIYETTGAVTEFVHGDVILRPWSSRFEALERRVETATLWAAEDPTTTNSARVVLAVRNVVAPAAWHALESAAESLLRSYAQGSSPVPLPPGPVWDALVAGFMSAILEDGVRTPEELRTQHKDYRDVAQHLNAGGNVDELVHSLVPRWMRHPLDLTVEGIAS